MDRVPEGFIEVNEITDILSFLKSVSQPLIFMFYDEDKFEISLYF